MTWRVVIVDDEQPARTLLREMLSECDDIVIVGEAANGFDAVKVIDAERPDIAFLDIQMPRLSGFEALELIDPSVAVVFATAYDQYAVRAFEVHAVDYLLKPFSQQRLAAALQRAKGRRGAPPTVAAGQLAQSSRAPEAHCERIVIRDGTHVHILPVGELDWAQAQGDYVELHSGNQSWLKQQTLQTLAESLNPGVFARVHRSYLINVTRLLRIETLAKDNRVAILQGGKQIPISRSGQQRLSELLR